MIKENDPLFAYPRPQLQRAEWMSLNGQWDFALDHAGRWRDLSDVEWAGNIKVPFAPETEESGVKNAGLYRACWYRRTFDAAPLAPGHQLVLHFGAVDYAATVWVNGHVVATHEGGYTPFQADITSVLQQDGHQTIVVCANDDPLDLSKPRGKQDWHLESHSIWYPRTTGIWQPVWCEILPPTWIASLTWTANLERWEIGLAVVLEGNIDQELVLHVRLEARDQLLARDRYAVSVGEVHRRIELSDPGIDDYRNELLWSPALPTLIDAYLELWDQAGNKIDEVKSYTALRSIAIQGDRFLLNGRPYFLRMVLDQGYWPASGLTPPSDAALKRDVELARSMGFNTVRKHQKIEMPRYLYWADRLGLLVWEEMPSAYRFTRYSVERLIREWMDVVKRDCSHPCIIVWVPLNESWGVPDLPAIAAQRNYVQTLYHLTHTLDPDRPVIGNDGWESASTDIVGIHDYDDDLDRLERRYTSEEVIPRLFTRERPGGRLIALQEHPHIGQPIMLTEFGGIWCGLDPDHTWGYTRAATTEELGAKYSALLDVIHRLPLFAGFCYTQFADTYQEANGLLYGDRSPKVPLVEIDRATRRPQARK
ncbi:MAG: glycoside hydrolase family 2 TIM barrel-domain containing protein [Herpetosiphon sp.]